MRNRGITSEATGLAFHMILFFFDKKEYFPQPAIRELLGLTTKLDYKHSRG
jgi:hypothetical protein